MAVLINDMLSKKRDLACHYRGQVAERFSCAAISWSRSYTNEVFNTHENQRFKNPPPNSPSKGGIQKIFDFLPTVNHTQ
jgi:hypothetical protein